MFGNREVCIGLSVAVEILPLVEIMQSAAHFVKRFTHDIDTLSRALTACLARDSFAAQDSSTLKVY